jgi:hypothetical protein
MKIEFSCRRDGEGSRRLCDKAEAGDCRPWALEREGMSWRDLGSGARSLATWIRSVPDKKLLFIRQLPPAATPVALVELPPTLPIHLTDQMDSGTNIPAAP